MGVNEQDTYRHEDIEALLMSKRFDELLQEERTFMLQHVKDAAEYTELREVLLQMHELSFDEELRNPPESLHTALMHGFAEHAEKVRGFRPRFAPWMGWAIAATIIGFVVIFFAPMWRTTETAEVIQAPPAPSPLQPVVADTASVVMPSKAENLYAQLPEIAAPPAPEVVEDIYLTEEAVKSVVLTAQESEEVEAPAVMDAPAQEEYTVVEDAAPSTSMVRESESKASKVLDQSATGSESAQARSSKQVIKPQKKKRKPEVRKLSQSKQLMKLLREEKPDK